jgi:hypothetical protein
MSARSALQIDTTEEPVTIIFAACLAILFTACNEKYEKDEAANVVRVVTNLRMADNDHKQGPLDQLRTLPCKSKEVCEARDACVQAFDHHVRGLQLGARLRRKLGSDASAGPEAGAEDDATALLLEMNLEVEEGRKAMPTCEQRVASLRRRHRL